LSAAFHENFSKDECRRLLTWVTINSAFPTLFLWIERIIFHTDLPGYLEFAHTLGRIGFLPPDTINRQWTIWESTYKNSRVGANFGYEANAYIVFIIPMIFFAYYLWRRADTARSRLGFGALALFLMSGLLTSLSRTGIFTLAACIFLFTPGRWRLFAAGGVAGLAVLLLALFPGNYFLERYTMQSTDSYSFAAKFVQIAEAFKSVFTHPASLLFGNPGLVDKDQGGFNPHNQFMYDMMAKGIFALAALVATFVALFRRANAEPAAGEAEEDPLYRKTLKMGLASVFITCWSTHVMINSNTSIVFWILIFFLLKMSGEKRLYRVSL
jgi:hypothetical protein